MELPPDSGSFWSQCSVIAAQQPDDHATSCLPDQVPFRSLGPRTGILRWLQRDVLQHCRSRERGRLLLHRTALPERVVLGIRRWLLGFRPADRAYLSIPGHICRLLYRLVVERDPPG